MASIEKSRKERLDKLLVDRGLSETRSQAQRLILSGEVMVNNQLADKPAMLFPHSVEIRVKEPPRFVSRGGIKLERALTELPVAVQNRVCLDVGASTGGFTDCLLQHGAAFVHAIDVGYGQFDWRLRQDPRVSVRERTHIRDLDCSALNPPPDLAVVDVSFISLKKVLPKAGECLSVSAREEGREIVALVKPQFEYRDYCLPKGFKGVVTDPEDLETVLLGLASDMAAEMTAWVLAGMVESPIRGPKGNREFFFYFVTEESMPVDSQEPLQQRIQRLLCNDS